AQRPGGQQRRADQRDERHDQQDQALMLGFQPTAHFRLASSLRRSAPRIASQLQPTSARVPTIASTYDAFTKNHGSRASRIRIPALSGATAPRSARPPAVLASAPAPHRQTAARSRASRLAGPTGTAPPSPSRLS